MNNKELLKIIKRDAGNKFKNGTSPYFSDNEYADLTLKELKQILRESQINIMRYANEVMDCDDFAYLLKAEFIKHSYKKNKPLSYPVGIVHGMLPFPHAINWVVADKKLFFIEPQSDEVFHPRKTDKDIWLFIA